MSNSIYHLFASLVQSKTTLTTAKKLEDFPFPSKMLSCKNAGTWPDLAIKVNKDRRLFSGGELIELKDSKTLTVSSFNSTIPVGQKAIAPLISGATSRMRDQVESAGDDILSLPIRDVYYLIRGKRAAGVRTIPSVRICLIHGKFFETVDEKTLIRGAFEQMLEERLTTSGKTVSPESRQTMISAFDDQHTFAQSRVIKKASVSLRFRIMTEVTQEGNILKYHEIGNDTLTFLAPCHNPGSKALLIKRMETAFAEMGLSACYSKLTQFEVKHRLNGPFWAFQIGL